MSIKEIAKKSIVPISSSVVGGLIVIAGLKLSPSVRSKTEGDVNHKQHNELIYDDIFQKQEGIRLQFDDLFNDNFGGTINDISKREDDNFVYYDIKVDDVKSTSINTKVESGYVTITGTVEKKSGSEGKDDSFSAQSIFKSSFNRTFPLPENVEQNKMQMLTEKDKVILKFPKTKA